MGIRLRKLRRQSRRLTRSLVTSRLPSPTLRMLVRSRTSLYVLFSHWTMIVQMLTASFQVDDVGKAHPRIVEAVETMIQKGKWTVPGMYIISADIRSTCRLTCTLPRLQGEVRQPFPHVDSWCGIEAFRPNIHHFYHSAVNIVVLHTTTCRTQFYHPGSN
jgi:hypothetical protein